MTAKIFALACIRGVLCTLFLFPKQAFCHMLRPFGTAYFSIPKLVTAEVIPLAVLGRVPQLAPQALCAVIQPPPDQFLRRGLDPFFQSVLHLGFLFDFIDISHLDPGGGALAPPWFYYAAKSEGLVVISL